MHLPQVYLLEREKAGLELRVGTCEAREMALMATIDLLKAQVNRSHIIQVSNDALRNMQLAVPTDTISYTVM